MGPDPNTSVCCCRLGGEGVCPGMSPEGSGMMYPSPVGNGPSCQGPWGWRGRCLPSCCADRLAVVGGPRGLALMTMVWRGCRVTPRSTDCVHWALDQPTWVGSVSDTPCPRVSPRGVSIRHFFTWCLPDCPLPGPSLPRAGPQASRALQTPRCGVSDSAQHRGETQEALGKGGDTCINLGL